MSRELRDALSISTVPGEILGELRLALRRVRRHPLYAHGEIRAGVDEALDALDLALGR